MNPLIMNLSQVAMNKQSPVIVALDFSDEDTALLFAAKLDPALCALKVGKELFTSSGRCLVEKLVFMGFRVFLDLKFHDIPNTVAKACKVAAQMGVWMVDVHASGGRRMLSAAREAITACNYQPLLIGVTVLTSMLKADLMEVGFYDSVENQVLRLAKLSNESGLDGVVCSAQEALFLREQINQKFLLVTPGIRLSGDASADQRRVMTPLSALNSGASYLVIGRSITQANDPMLALLNVIREVEIFSKNLS